MGRFDDLKKQLGDSFTKALDNEIRPGDESEVANNLPNYLVEKLGLPKEMQQTVADEKQHFADLPENMGMSAGSIAKTTSHITPEIIKVAQKARDLGIDALNSAEQILLKRASNKMNNMSDSTYVQTTRGEASAAKDAANINVRPKVIDTEARPMRFPVLNNAIVANPKKINNK